MSYALNIGGHRIHTRAHTVTTRNAHMRTNIETASEIESEIESESESKKSECVRAHACMCGCVCALPCAKYRDEADLDVNVPLGALV